MARSAMRAGREAEEPRTSVRVTRRAGNRTFFRYEIELDTRAPQDEETIGRLLEASTRFSEGSRRALAALSSEDAARLIGAALPAAQSTDEVLGPFYDSRGLADRWGISIQAVHKRAAAGKIIKVITKDARALYPSFQFAADGTPLPGLPAVLHAFAPEITDPWTIAAWLASPSTRLGGRRPAELLRSGAQTTVTDAAALFSSRLAA